jgi:hypothetical protein
MLREPSTAIEVASARSWVGSATKNDGRLSAVNSFTFYRNQLPGPEATQRAVFKKFC